MPSVPPVNASEYLTWLDNFIDVASSNEVVLGFTVADIAALNTSSSSVSDGISGAVSADSARKAAHEVKQQNLKNSGVLAREFIKRVNANPNVSVALKKQLGMAVRQPNTHTPPATPTALMTSGSSSGSNALSWKANGNMGATMYVIEKQIGTDTAWTFVDVTSRARYVDVNGAPGVKTAYRVYAKRSEMESEYSNVSVLYGS